MLFANPFNQYKFFVCVFDMAVNNALQSEDSTVESLDYSYIDQYSKLVLTILKLSLSPNNHFTS